MADFQEGEHVHYVVEGPIVALVETADGVGIVLMTGPGEGTVISGRQLDIVKRGSYPRDAEIKRLRARADDVRAIHPREISAVSMGPVCGSCRDTYEDPMPWPCPTIAELDGLDGGAS